MDELDFGFLIPISSCEEFSGIGDCKKINGLCIDNPNCYFKQLNKYKITLERIKDFAKEIYEDDATKYQTTGICFELMQRINEVLND